MYKISNPVTYAHIGLKSWNVNNESFTILDMNTPHPKPGVFLKLATQSVINPFLFLPMLGHLLNLTQSAGRLSLSQPHTQL